MKKQMLKFKLELKKENISNLNKLRGGKSIFDRDSEARLCGYGYPYRTVLYRTTCNSFCTYETWEVFGCR